MYITKWIAYTNKICLYQHTSICKEQHPCKASQCGSAVNLSNSDYTSYAKASMSTWAVRMRKNIVKGYTVVYATEGASLPATLLL